MNNWNKIFKPIVVLSLAAVIVTGALAATNSATKPVIDAAIAAAQEAARTQLIPDATGFTKVEGEFAGVSDVYTTDNNVGTVITCSGKGYSSEIVAMVAFSPDGTIMDMTITSQGETAGVGTKVVSEPSFQESFKGLEAKELALTDIDAITGATISSKATLNAVNSAIKAYELVSSAGGGDVASLEEREAQARTGAYDALFGADATFAEEAGADETVQAIATFDEGVAVTAVSEGFGGPIVLTVGFNTDDTIRGVYIIEQNENEEYGAKMETEPDFVSSFVGLTAETLTLDDVDAISGATGSSESALTAVNSAIAAYSQIA